MAVTDKQIEAGKWVPQIGQEVRVVRGCADWASDWVDAAGQPLRLWVVGVQAAHSGGFSVTVCEQWPLPPSRSPFEGGGLTDGFSVGQGCDQLEPIAMRAMEEPDVERVPLIFNDSQDTVMRLTRLADFAAQHKDAPKIAIHNMATLETDLRVAIEAMRQEGS